MTKEENQTKTANGKKVLKAEIIIAIIAVLFGGGSFFGVKIITAKDIKDEVIKEIKPAQGKNDECIKTNTENIERHENTLNTLVPTVESIQYIQHRQYAQQEARRVTESIYNRTRREQAYDRIREINLKRLNSGKDVCLSVDCN